MGKEIKRFLVFCSLVSMLAVNLFAESLNAQSSKQNGQGATMNNQTGFTLSVPSEYTRQVSQRGTYMNASNITTKTKIRDIISDPELGDWGRLLFPVKEGYYSGDTLRDLHLTWYSHINPQKTVEIVQYVKERTENGEQVFFDIYSEAEKRADPAKQNTGLFFFRGRPGAKTAICNAQAARAA